MVSNNDQETVLVIGATGRHGGTGARVVERLQAAGRLVRALVRSDDDRAQRLRESGVHTLVGDLHDRRTLLPALDGAESVYVAYPVAAGTVDALANVASVIRELGSSPHVVMNGNGAADHNAPSGFAREHALAEELLIELGVNFTSVRGGAFFYENVLLLHSDAIRETGVFANSFGDARPAWISATDFADLCASALLEPHQHANPRSSTRRAMSGSPSDRSPTSSARRPAATSATSTSPRTIGAASCMPTPGACPTTP
jgi:uncharacterized protein YbjT (DUF2867 family)